jgi:hypothetical protein
VGTNEGTAAGVVAAVGVAAGVATGVEAVVEAGVEASVAEGWLSGPVPSAGVTDADGAGDASLADAEACGTDCPFDPDDAADAADPTAGGAAGAKITVGASVTMGRAAIVTRCESSGVQGRALAR